MWQIYEKLFKKGENKTSGVEKPRKIGCLTDPLHRKVFEWLKKEFLWTVNRFREIFFSYEKISEKYDLSLNPRELAGIIKWKEMRTMNIKQIVSTLTAVVTFIGTAAEVLNRMDQSEK